MPKVRVVWGGGVAALGAGRAWPTFLPLSETSPTFPSLAWSAPWVVVEVQIHRNVNVNSERAGLLHLQLTTALTTINFSAGEGGQTIGRQVPGRQAATSPPPAACYRRTGRRVRDARHQQASAQRRQS